MRARTRAWPWARRKLGKILLSAAASGGKGVAQGGHGLAQLPDLVLVVAPLRAKRSRSSMRAASICSRRDCTAFCSSRFSVAPWAAASWKRRSLSARSPSRASRWADTAALRFSTSPRESAMARCTAASRSRITDSSVSRMAATDSLRWRFSARNPATMSSWAGSAGAAGGSGGPARLPLCPLTAVAKSGPCPFIAKLKGSRAHLSIRRGAGEGGPARGQPGLTNTTEPSLSSSRLESTLPKSWISLATPPVQPVWWLAPRPTPVSPWKYS